jgi:2-polyprenyl-6-methoxyphenol hydroxylase-like FAD-dependent oxidoreductase
VVSPDVDVTVVGAGPSGLSLALQARSIGASVRIIERREGPRDWAPALAVHARTLESLDGLGVADELVARGVSEADLVIHIGGSTFTGALHHLDLPHTRYPLILFVTQRDVETVLRERLSALGVEVEWDTEFSGLVEGGERMAVHFNGPDGRESISSRFVVGCDGAESAVRGALDIPFRGRRYREAILVADVEATAGIGPGEAHAYLAAGGIMFLFPIEAGRFRLIAPLGPEADEAGVMRLVSTHTRGEVEISAVSWIRVIRPQHRVAGSYRRGRVFLAGDAAHVHSPAGAQGMNTGIQDAANLGWKVALAARGAPDALLDTYETERRPVARRVVALTGLAFALEVSEMLPLRVGRRWAARPVAATILPRPKLLSRVARVVSGLDTRYRKGALTGDGSGMLTPGSRLPDLELTGAPVSRLQDLIDGSSFHLLRRDVETTDPEPGLDRDVVLRTHRIDGRWLPEPAADFPALVLVRPDGHIALVSHQTGIGAVETYMSHWVGDAELRRDPTAPSTQAPS